MNDLELRKQLLTMESNLNRARLLTEISGIQSGVRHRFRHSSSKTEIAASAAALALAVAATAHNQRTSVGGNHPRLQSVLKGAALISNTLLAFLSQRDK